MNAVPFSGDEQGVIGVSWLLWAEVTMNAIGSRDHPLLVSLRHLQFSSLAKVEGSFSDLNTHVNSLGKYCRKRFQPPTVYKLKIKCVDCRRHVCGREHPCKVRHAEFNDPTSNSILSLDICMTLSWSNVTESGNDIQGRDHHLRSTVEKGGFGGTYPHGN